MGKILIIDDDVMTLNTLSRMINDMGHKVTCAAAAEAGLKEAQIHSYDVVFLDVNLPDANGLTLLPDICRTGSAPEVIIITGYGTPDGAELAMKNGAWDFIEKPADYTAVELTLTRALQYMEAKKGRETPLLLKREGIIGSSSVMEACMKLVAQAAVSEASVLISGETGTGKELIARAIHNNSPRSSNAIVIVDCASLPPTIIESILFGHAKGAFTGADKHKEGLIKQANGGTLFLDEVGELPLPAQKAFLRILQEHRFRPLGETEEVESEFRLVAATNRDLEKMVNEGKFREDLFFRLRTFAIEVPPLREHPEDIKKLAIHYVERLCNRQGEEMKGISHDFIEAMNAYNWPGNIRELVNAMESALTVATGNPVLYAKHLPIHIRVCLARNSVNKNGHNNITKLPEKMCTLKEARESAAARREKQYLDELITMTRGDVSKACKIAGVCMSWMYQLIKKYGIGTPGRIQFVNNKHFINNRNIL